MKTWTFDKLHPPAGGPWDIEPDKAQWVDEASNLDCLIVRGPVGALCGYVGVPTGHPYHGKDYDDVEVDVHGGLTFAASCQEGVDEDGPGICHVPLPGRDPHVWWLGFDCAHAFDYTPKAEARLAESGFEYAKWPYDPDKASRPYGTEYRTFDYVKSEVESLAKQAAAASS